MKTIVFLTIVFRWRILRFQPAQKHVKWKQLFFWQLFSDGEFLDFSGFEKFLLQLFGNYLFSCMCVWESEPLYVGTSVRACVCTYASTDEWLGPLNNMLLSHDSSSTIFSQSWAETSELPGRISTSELDPQPWHFTNNRIIFPSPEHSLGWTLYPPSTPHFTRAAHLPHPLPKRVRLRGVHWHRTGWRLVGCTPRIHLQTA